MNFARINFQNRGGSNTGKPRISAANLGLLQDGIEEGITKAEAALPAAVVGCSLRTTEGQNPVAGEYGWQPIGLSDEILDSNNSHDAAGGSTWEVAKTGWHQVVALGAWNANANGRRGVRVIRVAGWGPNSAAHLDLASSEVNATAGGPNTIHSGSGFVYLYAANVIQFLAYQQGSGAIVTHKGRGEFAPGSGMDVFFRGV